MKSFKLYLSTLLLLLSLGAVSCNDDFDTPPTNVPVATIQANTTIAQLKQDFWKDETSYIEPVGSGKIIQGRVISSDAAGNIYKQLYIQDETGAICISLDASSLYTTYRVGQQIVINLDSIYIGKYAGLMQLGIPNPTKPTEAGRMSLALFQESAQINELPNLAKIDTTVVTIPELPNTPAGILGEQSRLVRLNNVRWQEAGQTYCEPSTASTSGYANTSRTLVDEDGNTIIVRNSGYANFKAEILPEGVGSVVGILSYFTSGSNGTWQILLNSTDDCIDFQSASTEGTKNNPYDVATALTLMNQDKTGWVNGYIVGAVNPGVSNVTSNNDIQWGAPTVLDNTIVVAPSADVTNIAQCIIVSLPDGSALRSAANLKDNANVYKKEIKINGVLKNFMGQGGITTAGASSDFVLETPTASGTEDDPFSVPQVIAKATATAIEGAWVEGYIVGYVNGADYSAGAVFSATGESVSQSNILLAPTTGTTVATQCIPVQLVYNTTPRNELNLSANPANLGKKVKIKGTLQNYFNVPGLKTATEYKFVD